MMQPITLMAAMMLTSPTNDPMTLVFQQGSAYRGTRDTHLDAAAANVDFGSDADVKVDHIEPNHGIIRMDGIIGLAPGSIPPGSCIIDATLTVHVTDPSPDDSSVHRLLAPVYEDDTWNMLDQGVDGCELDPIAEASFVSIPVGPLEIDVTRSLQLWSSGAVNYGWALFHHGPSPNGWILRSSEDPNPVLRPRLEVTFCASCSADVDGNCVVDFADVLALIAQWGQCTP